MRADDGTCNLLVAGSAGPFCHLRIARADLDVVWKETCRESPRVVKSVFGLHSILPKKVMGCVTVVALRHRMMPRLHPCVVILLHHVTVGASRRIIGQVGVAPGVDKRVET